MNRNRYRNFLAALCRRLRRCPRGNVAIEFGFMVPVFLLVVLAAAELGRLGIEWATVTNAAKAGAQYGVQDQSNAADIAGMIQAARDDAGDVNNLLTVAARQYCRCPGTTVETPCSDECVADTTFAPMYVEVTVSESLSAIYAYANLPASYAISVTSTSRVR